MPRVFISHAGAEAPLAAAIRQYLRLAAPDLAVTLSSQVAFGAKPGAQLTDVLGLLEAADAILVVGTPRFFESPYCMQELGIAAHRSSGDGAPRLFILELAAADGMAWGFAGSFVRHRLSEESLLVLAEWVDSKLTASELATELRPVLAEHEKLLAQYAATSAAEARTARWRPLRTAIAICAAAIAAAVLTWVAPSLLNVQRDSNCGTQLVTLRRRIDAGEAPTAGWLKDELAENCSSELSTSQGELDRCRDGITTLQAYLDRDIGAPSFDWLRGQVSQKCSAYLRTRGGIE
jgi:hypothetical protein